MQRFVGRASAYRVIMAVSSAIEPATMHPRVAPMIGRALTGSVRFVLIGSFGVGISIGRGASSGDALQACRLGAEWFGGLMFLFMLIPVVGAMIGVPYFRERWFYAVGIAGAGLVIAGLCAGV